MFLSLAIVCVVLGNLCVVAFCVFCFVLFVRSAIFFARSLLLCFCALSTRCCCALSFCSVFVFSVFFLSVLCSGRYPRNQRELFFFPCFSSFFVSFFCFKTYDVKFRDIATGKDLDDVIIKTSGDVCWGADATTVFYTTQAGIGLLLDVAFLMVVLVVSVVLLVLVFSSL